MRQRNRLNQVVLGLLILCRGVYAQVTTATVYGTITDPTGAAISSAPVSLSNELTGATASTHSNVAGEFTFTFLPVGAYTISIEAQGSRRSAVRAWTLSQANLCA
jgi:hypothetical protein